MKTPNIAISTSDQVAREFNERPWTKQGTWPGAFLWFFVILESFSEEWTGLTLDPRLGIRDYACIDQPHGGHDCYIGSQCFDELRTAMEQGFADSGLSYFQEYASLCISKGNEWMNFACSIFDNRDEFSNASNERLAILLREYFVHMRANGAFMDTIIVLADLLGDVMGSHIDQILKANGIDDPSAFRIFLDVHSQPPRPTSITESNASIKRIAGLVNESLQLPDIFLQETPHNLVTRLESGHGNVRDAIREHISQFGWMNTYSFSGEQSSIEDIIQFIQDEMEQPQYEAEADADSLDQADQSDLRHAIERLTLTPEARTLLEITSALTYVNTWKDDVHQMTWRDIQPLVESIAQRLNCTVGDLTLSTPEEIENALLGGKLDSSMLAMRREAWSVLKLSSTVHVIQGRFNNEALRGQIMTAMPVAEKTLKGRPIFPGHAKGQVRIVLTVADCDRVKVGDVLVATNTSPDFIPAMRRASAFVTDTGNLICHAVIAAREFKKPCVIATKIATQVLKEGEWVDVDGASGLVTRLNTATEE
jgi:phosphohistidine swiveling domain-containing protein